MPQNLNRLSKFLALMLRHRADDFGLTLDKEGFTDVEQVWQIIQTRYGKQYTLDDLYRVVEGDAEGKKRYEIRGQRIRAMYGHSHQVNEIIYQAVTPPEILYHGTSSEALPAIRKSGLQARGRQYVHLTINPNVAQRHSQRTVMLRVRAGEAHQAGFIFHRAETEHYLTFTIPPEYIDFPEE